MAMRTDQSRLAQQAEKQTKGTKREISAAFRRSVPFGVVGPQSICKCCVSRNSSRQTSSAEKQTSVRLEKTSSTFACQIANQEARILKN